MKYLFYAFLFFCALSAKAQDEKSTDDSLSNLISYTTPKKDTLYLVNNTTGKIIASLWDGEKYDNTKGKKPVIVFVDKNVILARSTSVKRK